MASRKIRRSREFKKSSNVVSIEEAREARRKRRKENFQENSQENKAPTADTKDKRAGKKEGDSKRKGKQRKRNLLKGVAVVLCTIIIGTGLYGLVNLKVEEGKLDKEKATLQEQKKKLEEELKNANSPSYIEEQAREQLNLIMPGEILYVIPEKEKK